MTEKEVLLPAWLGAGSRVEATSEKIHVATLGDRDDAHKPCLLCRWREVRLVRASVAWRWSASQWRDAVNVGRSGAGRDNQKCRRGESSTNGYSKL